MEDEKDKMNTITYMMTMFKLKLVHEFNHNHKDLEDKLKGQLMTLTLTNDYLFTILPYIDHLNNYHCRNQGHDGDGEQKYI